MTMMVRDEADIIAATLEHHLAQGIDRILVTDNASTDGTREILDRYAAVAPVTVMHDGEHRKQQAQVVTRMARMAFDEHGADWVVNGDADEFLRPVDPALSLRDVFAAMPTSLGSFTAPVTNMVGPIARRGSGVRRLQRRDERSLEVLRAAGVLQHPTPNAIHVGSPDVEVAHGNHFVSIAQSGEVPAGLELEVLHLPWRSSEQFERKTENMGRGYEANPALRPSANHHGMRDWRRQKAGVLLPFLALRMPTADDLDAPGFVPDDSLARSLDALEPRVPELLAAALDDAGDEPFTTAEILELRERAELLSPLDRVAQDEIVALRAEVDARNADLYEARLTLADPSRDPELDARLRSEREQAWLRGVQHGQAVRDALEGQLADARGQAAHAFASRDAAIAELERIRAHPALRAVRMVRSAMPSRR